jgi:hypothetical protein
MYSWTFGIKDLASAKLNAITSNIKEANTAAVGLGATFSNIGSVAALAIGGGMVASISLIGEKVVSTLSEFERFEAVLTNTLGSNSAAQSVLKGITDFAAQTPFQVDELTGAFVKLANQGFAPSVAEMTKLGNLASSTGKDFNSLAEAVIDAQVGEFERLKEFGIQAEKSNGKVTFSFKNQKTVVDENASAIRAYMLSLGNMKGVAGSMAAISATTGGQISNMKDQVTALYLSIGQTLKPIIADTMSYFLEKLTATAQWVRENQEKIRGWIDTFIDVSKSVLVAYGTFRVLTMGVAAYQAVTFVATNATTILSAAQAILNAVLTANPIGLVIMGLSVLAGAITYAWNKSETFRATVTGLWSTLKTFGGIVYDFAIRPLIAFGEILIGVFTMDTNLIQKGMKDGVDALKATAENFYSVGSKLGTSFTEGYKEGMQGFAKSTVSASGVTDPFADYLKKNPTATGFDFAKKAVGGGSMKGLDGVGKAKSIEGGGNIKTINIRIDKLVEKIENNFGSGNDMDARKIKEIVTLALIDATNDFNRQ